MPSIRNAFLVSLAVLGALGCSGTSGGRDAARGGFLGDYAMLEPSGEGRPLRVSGNPKADWSRYDSITLDPVSVWRAEGSSLEEVPEDELQVLVDYLDAVLRASLAEDWQLVDRAGPGVLRVRVALTEAEGAPVATDTVSAVVPQLLRLPGTKRIAPSTDAFASTARIEVELVDSITWRRLIAAVERGAEDPSLEGEGRSWDEVRASFAHWAERIRRRLDEERRGAATAP